ncbi:ATP-binding cassette domain-containing protein [Candidatus Mycoplasma pogonae]
MSKELKLPDFINDLERQLKNTIQKNNSNYVLELNNVDKIYDNGFQAVFGTNIKLEKGEFLALLGPSGCGKTTTLRIIAGLEEVSQGEILINNVNVTNSEPAARNLTMVFQNYALFPHLSVKNNIAFGLKANKNKLGKAGEIFRQIKVLENDFLANKNRIFEIKNIDKNALKIKKYQRKLEKLHNKLKLVNPKSQKYENLNIKAISMATFIQNSERKIAKTIANKDDLPDYMKKALNLKLSIAKLKPELKQALKEQNNKKIIEEKVAEAAKILGLEYYLNQKPAALSGGQRQRVALGRSIVSNPTLFLMDEPLSNLDAKLRATMRKEIRSLHHKVNSGTIYVTHDQIEAMTMADKIAVMTDGFVLQYGTPNEIYRNPSTIFVASFVGTPAINLIYGKYSKGYIHSDKGIKIKIPQYKTNNLEEGQKIVIGLRPTDFSTIKEVGEAYDYSLKVKISQEKEMLGNEYLYRAKILGDSENSFGEEITFITSSYEDFEINQTVTIYPILSRMHIFDQETTVSLSSEFNLETIQALKNWISSNDKIEIRRKLLEKSKEKGQRKSLLSKIIKMIKNKVKK